jgi:hypothetical protein
LPTKPPPPCQHGSKECDNDYQSADNQRSTHSPKGYPGTPSRSGGRTLAYELQPDGALMMRKLQPFDCEWHQALSATLGEEWSSPENEEAFGDL